MPPAIPAFSSIRRWRTDTSYGRHRGRDAPGPVDILAGMIVDVTAPVLYNRRLSPHYNVIALGAPAIAAAARPGQFVMVKPAPGLEPLLRRPFSIFQVLRDAGGAPVGITLLNKRVGITVWSLSRSPGRSPRAAAGAWRCSRAAPSPCGPQSRTSRTAVPCRAKCP